MPNFELPNDEIVTVSILTQNGAGATEPPPASDTFMVTGSNPASLNAVLGTDAAGGPAVVMNALVKSSPGLTVTVSDSAGLAQYVLTVDIVEDVTPTNIVLDVADATHTSQPVPAAPGP